MLVGTSIKSYSLFVALLLFVSSIAIVPPGAEAHSLTVIGVVRSTGEMNFGHFVESVPDITGDGLSELLVGNPFNNSGGNFAGEAYIFFSPLEGKNITNTNADVTFRGDEQDMNLGFSGASVPGAFPAAGGEIAIGCPGNDSENGVVGIFETSTVKQGGTFSLDDADHIVAGENGERLGHSVAYAGDVNNDTVPDLVIGANEGGAADYGSTNNRSGRAYLIYGGANPPETSSSADVAISGYEDGGDLGFAVSFAGDVNGDDTDDVIVGAPSTLVSGVAYIFYGRDGALPPDLNISNANVSVLRTNNPIGENMELGYSLNYAGDFNGDGLDDVIIGAPGFNKEVGAACMVFGNTSLGDIDIGATPSGYVTFIGMEHGRFGHSVTGLSDMENDGFEDIMIGAPLMRGERGFTYTFFGNSSFDSIYIPTSKANTTNNGSSAGEKFGYWVSEGRMVDADVFPDAFCSAPNASSGNGKAHILKLNHLPTLTVLEPVTPAKGNATTDFTYRVVYADHENDPPVLSYPMVRIYTELDGSKENQSTPNVMRHDPSAPKELKDGDYRNGEQYYYTTKLVREEDFNYRFEVKARRGWADQVNTSLQADPTTGPLPVVDTTPPPEVLRVEAVDTPNDLGGSVEISWDPLEIDDFGGYEIYVGNESPHDGKFDVEFKQPEEVIEDANVTNYTLRSFEGSPLENFRYYWVGVGAIDDVRNRRLEVEAHKVMPKDDSNLRPGNITDLNATTGSNEGEVVLSWTAVGEDGMSNGPVRDYLVKTSTVRAFHGERDWDNGDPVELNLTIRPPRQKMETVVHFEDRLEHYFAVRAVDGVGQLSDISNSPRATPAEAPDATPPEPILGVEIYDIADNNTAIGVHWLVTKAPDFHHYNIYISEHSFSWLDQPDVYLERSDITDKGVDQATLSSINGDPLEFGKKYYVAVTAVDKSGNENKTVVCSKELLFIDDLDQDPPGPVSGVFAKDTDNDDGGSITVEWNKCSAADFLKYEVYISSSPVTAPKVGGASLAREVLSRETVSAEVTGYGGVPLADGTKYHFAVVARDYNGLRSEIDNGSRYGPVESVNDSDTEVPAAVTGLRIVEAGKTNMTLGWRPLVKEDLPDFHQYVVYYSTTYPLVRSEAERLEGKDEPSLLSIGTGTEKAVNVTGLELSTDYHFAVLCQDDRMGKERDYSGNLSVTVNGTTFGENILPELSRGEVSPATGKEGDTFTFKIKYEDRDSPPDRIHVVIDGKEFLMTYKNGANTTGAFYIYRTDELEEGQHQYYFTVLDTYFKGDVTKKVRFPAASVFEFTVEEGDEEETSEDFLTAEQVILFVIPMLVMIVVIAGVLKLLTKRRRKRGEESEEGQRDIPVWSCTCGEEMVPITESGHCGYCGDSHTAVPKHKVEEYLMWSCTCGEEMVSITESGHCGYCGDSHDPIPEHEITDYVLMARGEEEGEEKVTAEELYGNLPSVSTEEDISSSAGTALRPSLTPKTGEETTADTESVVKTEESEAAEASTPQPEASAEGEPTVDPEKDEDEEGTS